MAWNPMFYSRIYKWNSYSLRNFVNSYSKLTKKQNIQMYNQIYFVAIIKFDGACVMVNAAAHKHKIWSKWFNILEYYFIIPTLISISYKLKWTHCVWRQKSNTWNISFSTNAIDF